MMEWINRIRNQKILKGLSIKMPLTSKSYGKSACLHVEEGARFERVGFHCKSLEIGAYSYMHSGELYMVSKIGRYCSIAERVLIGVDPVGHPLDWLSTHPFQFTKKYLSTQAPLIYESEWSDVEIGHDVWIGQEAVIMKGVKIGNGAVIGARSIVTRDIPDYAIAVGMPAKVIKYRFPDQTIQILRKYPWWELSVEKLKPIKFDSINTALEQFSKVNWVKAEFRSMRVRVKSKRVYFNGD